MNLAEEFRSEVVKWLKEEQQVCFSAEEEENYYATAFALYERGAYRKASPLFTKLVLANPFSCTYWRALASSKQMGREYEAALHAWALVALLAPEDPLPHFHAAECLFALGEREEAKRALLASSQLNHDDALDARIEGLRTYVSS